MKKQLLFGMALALGFAGFAQQNARAVAPMAKQAVPFKRLEALKGNEAKKTGGQTPISGTHAKLNPVLTATTTIIGETQYDLQSNSSMASRIINHPDGTISAVWTICDAGDPYTNRGTGYNYFDGTSWLYPSPSSPVVTTRFELFRTGFPAIGTLRGTRDVIMNHDGTNLIADTNVVKGLDSFIVFQTSATNGGANGPLWPRLAVGGSDNATLHAISNYTDTTAIVNGVKQPMVYSRSLDGGVNWDIVELGLPGYDNTITLYGSAEEYAIDAVGNNVGIVRGGLGEHVALWKSADNGTTWNRILVDSFPYVPDWTVYTPVGDTVPTNDGSVAVAIDQNGKAHVAYGYTEVTNSATGTGFFPGQIGLIYWNEITKTKIDIPITLAAIDADGSGFFEIGDSTTSYDYCRYGNNGLLCKPTIGMDGNGGIYIVFSLPADNDIDADGYQSFRDVWVVASTDNGATWSDAINLTNSVGFEDAFPVIAKRVDNFLHIIYQTDFEPGTALHNSDADGTNEINYLKVDKTLANVGIKEQNNASFAVGQNYPNPFNGTTNFGVKLNKASTVSVSVTDMFGKQVVNTVNYGMQTIGHHTFSVDCSKLSAGIYFYNVTCGNETITRKMITQ